MEEQRTEIAQQIVDTYPYPIATGVQKLLTSTEAFEKTAHLMSAFGLTLKYLTSIAIASYVKEEKLSRFPVFSLSRFLLFEQLYPSKRLRV